MAMERSANFSDEATEGRSSVWAEEDRVEREGWIVQRRQTGLKSGGVVEPGQNNFDFSRQISEKFRFFQIISLKSFDFSRQISKTFRTYFLYMIRYINNSQPIHH